MRRRLISLLLVLCMVLGMLPMTALAAEGENQAPVPGEDISIEMRLNDWYDVNLSEFFTDPEGDTLVYEVSNDGTNWTMADPIYSYYPAGTGTQKVYFKAVDSHGNASDILTLTADVAVPPSSVTVTLSISRGVDQFAYCQKTKSVMLPVTLTVPYFDLALYGLEQYYYNPICYSTHKEGDSEYDNSQVAGTKGTAEGIVTLMHVFIYATERFYLNLPASYCGTGYSYETGVFQNAISWTGGVGSSYMFLWDHGTNLNYYVNWEYPLGAHKWGSTSDQIALYGGEMINGHMINSSGTNGTNFSYFTLGEGLMPENQSFEATVRKGMPLELTVVRAYEDYSNADSTTAFAPDSGRSLYYCEVSGIEPDWDEDAEDWVFNWTKLDGQTNENGVYTLDTSNLEAGEYYVLAEGVIDGQKEVAPAVIKVTLKEAPDAALEIIQNGQKVEVKRTGIVYNDVNVYFAEMPTYGAYTVKDGLTGNGNRRRFNSLTSESYSASAQPVEITHQNYKTTKSDIEALYGAVEGLDSENTRLQAFQVYSLNDRMQQDKLLYVLVVEMPVVHVQKITLNETAISLPGGESKQLVATLTPADTSFTAVTWTSSNPDCVEVTQDGVITAYLKGEATITATSDGVSASCKVTVTKNFPKPSVIYSAGANSTWPTTNCTITTLTMHNAAASEQFTNGGNIYVTLDPDMLVEPDKLRLDIGYVRDNYGRMYIKINDETLVKGAYSSGTCTYEVSLTDGAAKLVIEGSSNNNIWVAKTVEFSTKGQFEIAPMLKGGTSATETLFLGETYKLDMERIFRSTSVNPMTYTVSVDGGEAVAYTEADGVQMTQTGTHTLKFTANNGCGNSPAYTVTTYVLDDAAIHEINYSVKGGVIEWVAFTDENRNPLPEGTTYHWDASTTTFSINLPTDYNKLGSVTTFYKLAKDDPAAEYPMLTGSNVIGGAAVQWNKNVRSDQTDKLNNGDVNAVVYLYETAPNSGSNVYKTFRFNFQRVKPDTAFQYQITDNGTYTIAGDVGGINGYSWINNGELHIALTEDTPQNAQLSFLQNRVVTTLENGAGVYKWHTGDDFMGTGKNWTIQYQIDKFPYRIETAEATESATIPALAPYELDLDAIFTDPDEGDTLTYQVKLNNGDWTDVDDADYSYIPANADIYTLTFRAFDGFVYSEDTYTITLTATNANVFYDVTVKNLPEEAKFFISKGFGTNGIYQPGDELTAEYANGIYTVKVPKNVSSIVMEAGEAWITATVDPEDATKNTLTLQKTSFEVLDKVNRPAEGTVTVKNSAGNTVGGENNVFYLMTGETYSTTVTPTGGFTTSWTTGTGTCTVTAAAQNTVQVNLEIRSPKTITIDEGAELNVVYQNGYYVLKSQEPLFSENNGDGTITYTYSCPNFQGYANGYMYFAKNGDLIDKAGYMKEYNDYTITWNGETRTSSYSKPYDPNYGRGYCGDDSVLVNINSQNHLVLNVGDTFRLRAFRTWEIISTDTENVMIEPEFTYTNYDKSMISLVSANEQLAERGRECGTGGNNWMDLTVNKSGTTFLEVGYEAIHMVTGLGSGAWGGAMSSIDNDVYNACDPARTALIVVQTDGNAATDVSFGIQCFSSTADSDRYQEMNSVPWDAEFDTLYFLGEKGEITFSPMADSGIEKVAVSHDKGRSWKTLTGEDGVYTMDVYSGSNIIRVTNGNGQTAYQVVRGDRISYSISLIKDANYSLTTDAGDTVRVKFHGLHIPVNKMSGIYNPGYDYGIRVTYDWNGEFAQEQNRPQYGFPTAAQIDLVISEDVQGAQYLTDGYINFNIFGDGPGSHRNLTDNGRGINTSAPSQKHTRSILPTILVYGEGNGIYIDKSIENGTVTASRDAAGAGEQITLTANANIYYKLASVTVTDVDGNAVEVENMRFIMPDTAVTVTAEFVSLDAGHVTGGEKLIAADAELIYAYINGTEQLNETQLALADVNSDGFVDTTDAALVYRIVNGTLDAFPQNGKEGE